MNDYKELIANLREEAEAVQAIEWEIPICTDNHIREAADAIEHLLAEVERLRAENRAKEQYIAETIGKVIKERAESPCDLCRFNPPSCLDKKPCTICPAVRRQSE